MRCRDYTKWDQYNHKDTCKYKKEAKVSVPMIDRCYISEIKDG